MNAWHSDPSSKRHMCDHADMLMHVHDDSFESDACPTDAPGQF